MKNLLLRRKKKKKNGQNELEIIKIAGPKYCRAGPFTKPSVRCLFSLSMHSPTPQPQSTLAIGNHLLFYFDFYYFLPFPANCLSN